MNSLIRNLIKIGTLALLLAAWSAISFAGMIEDDRGRWKSSFVDVDVTDIAYQWFLPFASSDRNKLSNLKVVSTFGSARQSYVRGHIHTGLDCDPKGKSATDHVTVYAMAKGRVCSIHLGDPHKTIVVKHKMPDGSTLFTSYKHLESIYLNRGDFVDRHSKVGRLYTRKEAKAQGGNYDHLHLEVRKRFDDYAVASWATMTKAQLDHRFINPYTFMKQRLTSTIPKILIINPELDRNDQSLVSPVLEKMQRNQKVTSEIVHYKEVNEALLASVNPDAIIITGQTTPWTNYNDNDFDGLRKILKSFERPVLGICGGHQLLALLNGGEVALIKGKLNGDTYAGCFREEGLINTRIVKEDLLLRGLSYKAKVYVSHCEEIKKMPDHYEVLLKGKKSKYQMMKHRTKPIYGVQFHPEWSTDDNPDGMVILNNFMEKVLADHE